MKKPMRTISSFVRNPIWWAALFFTSSGILVIGWAISYPILYSPLDQSILTQVSPLFWFGFCFSLIALGGLVQATYSTLIPWLASVSLILIITSPQLLYMAYGSDAGMLVAMVDYVKTLRNFDLTRDVSVITYAQWPTSIFFHRFLSDLFIVDSYTAVHLGFVLIAICVSAGLYLFWNEDKKQLATSRATFWGIFVYFAGFYWFFNWQAVPYTFALALFIPALALLTQKGPEFRLLLFLIVIVGMEAHAIYGVWMIIIAISIFAATFLYKGQRHWITYTLIILFLVAQVSIIIFKNVRFFYYLATNLQGYYQALLDTGASDKAIAIQAGNALSQSPPDLLGQILKLLAYLDLGFILLAFAVATVLVLVNRSLKARETGLFAAGAFYFIVGMFFAAIGTRSLQIIALVPAFFIVSCLSRADKINRVILLLGILGLLLFPSSIIRNHQEATNIVLPSEIAFKNFTSYVRQELIGEKMIFVEGVQPIDIILLHQVISPSTIQYNSRCNGSFVIINTTGLTHKIQQVLDKQVNHVYFQGFDEQGQKLGLAKTYDIGDQSLLTGNDCNVLIKMFHN